MSATYQIVGTTDDVTECGVCGRTDLKSTVVLAAPDGEIHAGSDCASKLAGKPVRDIERQARAADRKRIENDRRAQHQAWRKEADAERFAILYYATTKYGTQTPAGRTYFSLLCEWRDAGKPAPGEAA